MKFPFTRKALIPAVVSAMLLPMSLSAVAGDHPQHHGSWQEKRTELFDRADIDVDQREQLDQARTEYQQALEELSADYAQQRQDILGEDGIAALKQAIHDIREERITTLMDEWQLSDEDRASLQQTREDFRSNMKSLADQQFDSDEDRHQAWKELRTNTHDALAEVLSEEQIQELTHALMPRGPRFGGDHDMNEADPSS